MAYSYTRQSSMSDGDTITAALFNNEYNQLVNAFAYHSSTVGSTGHRHDGTAGHGGNVHTIGDLDFLNKIAVSGNTWGFFVEVSSAAVEQIRISDGVLAPVTDSDVDLGTSSLEFKDLFIDGTAHIDTLDVDVNGTVAGTFGVTGATTLSSTLAVTGAVTGSSTLQGTTITATTAFVPDASDGAALGTSALEFSDLFLADGAVINFGDDQDVSLTHVADTGLLISSTDQLQFGDSGTYIYQSADGVLDLVSDTEIELTATTIDINGNVDVSGTLTVAGAVDFGDAALSNVGAVQLDSIAGDGDTDTSITFSGSNVITIKAANADQVTFIDGAIVPSTDNDIDLGTSSTEFKDAFFDGTVTSDAFAGPLTGDVTGNVSGTAATVTTAAQSSITSLGTLTTLTVDNVIVNGTTIGHTSDTDLLTLTSAVLTVAGELDAATLDISGNADIDGTTNLDAVDIDGAVQIDATFTSGVDGQGYDTKFFGDTSSAYILWDTSADKLLTAGGAVIDIVKDKLLIGGTAVTTTAAELNILDTVTATATELNYSDLTTLGTSAASKVLSADANNLTKITGGVYLEEDTLTFDATQDWDVRASPVAQVTLTANVTFDVPSNPTTGQYISILCIQDGTGSRTIAWNALFEFTGGTAPTATTTAAKGDLFTFRYHNSHWIEVGRNLNLTVA